MWWWRKIRKAEISGADRDIFERFGEQIIGAVLAGGFNPRAADLQRLYMNEGPLLNSARDWLTERGDAQERREQRMETVEWAVLIFVVLGVIVEAVQLFRSVHLC